MEEKGWTKSYFQDTGQKEKLFSKVKWKCIGCDKFIDRTSEYQKVNTNERVISEETAYQMTSILSGLSKRNNKKLNSLNVPLGGKTGTTNNNYDAWDIGFHLI